jgi:hypothetical protein
MVSAFHRQAQDLSAQAALLLKERRRGEAQELFSKAAELEWKALGQIDSRKTRTWGILAVSVASLYYKAKDFRTVERNVCTFLSRTDLAQPWRNELREILEAAWDEESLARDQREYSGAELRVALRGGQIGSGTAPMFVALDALEGATSFVYRVAEYSGGFPFRERGLPSPDVRHAFEARATQPSIGSFQFVIKLTQPAQKELFGGEIPAHKVEAEAVTAFVMNLVRVTNTGTVEQIRELVPDRGYRDVLLKLLRRIAPNEKAVGEVQITRVSYDATDTVMLLPGARSRITEAVREQEPEEVSAEVCGILRNLSLDRKWVELRTDDGAVERCTTRGLLVDDVIGPMVNRHVMVACVRNKKGDREAVDIQLDEEKE